MKTIYLFCIIILVFIGCSSNYKEFGGVGNFGDPNVGAGYIYLKDFNRENAITAAKDLYDKYKDDTKYNYIIFKVGNIDDENIAYERNRSSYSGYREYGVYLYFNHQKIWSPEDEFDFEYDMK